MSPPTARVQRGPAEAARCASTGDSPGHPPPLADFVNSQLGFLRIAGHQGIDQPT